MLNFVPLPRLLSTISVYDGGWFEWSQDKKNPVESGDIN